MMRFYTMSAQQFISMGRLADAEEALVVRSCPPPSAGPRPPPIVSPYKRHTVRRGGARAQAANAIEERHNPEVLDSLAEVRAASYNAFGVFGTTLPYRIGVFHSSAPKPHRRSGRRWATQRARWRH